MNSHKTTLRPLTEADVPLLARWFFDPEVVHWLQLSEDPPQLRSLEAVRERFVRMRDDPSVRVWRIDTADGKPIGQIELVNIHRLQKRAEMHVCIGEKNFQNGGYGTDAIRQFLRLAFDELNLRRIYATPDEDNVRAIKCFEKCGFKKEGILRAHRLRYGKPINMMMMGVLREECETL